jgi:hypothetical protein
MTQQAQRVIDLKLPLSWLIGSAGVIIGLVITVTWNASAQTRNLENKIDLLIVTNTKMEKRLDDRDGKTDNLYGKVNDLERAMDGIKMRLDFQERSRK